VLAPPRPSPRPARRAPPYARRRLTALGILVAAVAVLWIAAVTVLAGGGEPARRAAKGRPAPAPAGAPRPHAAQTVFAAAGSPALFPFRPSPAQRAPTTADDLAPYWGDGRPCAVGCRPRGAIDGWPLRPFHGAHALRAGLNERRPSGFHIGIDIQARDGSRVYAIQPGRAEVLQATGVDSRVKVGNYIYWHIRPAVAEGEQVTPYRTVVGSVNRTAGHLHLSEVTAAGAYLNPLRPGGRVLAPWGDTVPPVIGPPHIASDGTAVVSAFDPQSTRVRTTYDTPVLAPAALAYAVFDASGQRVSPLEWAIRGSHLLPDYAIGLVYDPRAHSPGWSCFSHGRRCVPDWTYRLAGGLAPPLVGVALQAGVYRLCVYAWDWAGNAAARDVWFGRGLDGTLTSFLPQ
jgi:hypothetical protein